jgi:hypothetical protein
LIGIVLVFVSSTGQRIIICTRLSRIGRDNNSIISIISSKSLGKREYLCDANTILSSGMINILLELAEMDSFRVWKKWV